MMMFVYKIIEVKLSILLRKYHDVIFAANDVDEYTPCLLSNTN